MLRLKPQLMIFLSGLPFFIAGVMLTRKGLGFISDAIRMAEQLPSWTFPFVRPLSSIIADGTAITVVLVALAFALGLVKGRKVIVPSMERNFARLQAFTSPAPLTQLYDRKGWIVLGVMMSLGMLINNLPIPIDLRGFIDLTIGVGLLQGGIASLRLYRSVKPA